MSLITEFRKRLIDSCKDVESQCGYGSGRFLRQLDELGPVDATVASISSEKIPDGLAVLIMKKRLDLSLEAIVLEEKWKTIIPVEIREKARARLIELNYLQ